MFLRSLLCGVAIAGTCIGTANAFSSIPTYLKDGYKDDKDYKPFLEMVDGLKQKCDVCHIPGVEKKQKGHGLNDFGKVFHDRFKHKDYTAATKENKKEEAMKVFKDAWEASVKEKNTDGKVFLDLIKEGKLPGNNEKKE